MTNRYSFDKEEKVLTIHNVPNVKNGKCSYSWDKLKGEVRNIVIEGTVTQIPKRACANCVIPRIKNSILNAGGTLSRWNGNFKALSSRNKIKNIIFKSFNGPQRDDYIDEVIEIIKRDEQDEKFIAKYGKKH